MNSMLRKCATALVFSLVALAAAFSFDQGSAQPARSAQPGIQASHPPVVVPVWACKPVSPCCPWTPSCPYFMPSMDPRSSAPPPIGLEIGSPSRSTPKAPR